MRRSSAVVISANAAPIEADSFVMLVLRQDEDGGDDRRQRQRHVDEKDRPPFEVPQIEREDRAAEDLSGDGGDADDRTENAERLGPIVRRRN